MKLKQKQCVCCSRPFQTWENSVICCSQQCDSRHQALKKYVPKEENSEYKKPLLIGNEKECRHCGTIFYGGNSKYCCPGCRIAREIYEKKENVVICRECGTEFIKQSNNAEFCSFPCSNTWAKRDCREKKRIQRLKEGPKDRRKGKPVSYDELNRRAEKKRLDEEWKKLTR